MPSDEIGPLPDPRSFLIPVGESRDLSWLEARGYDLNELGFKETSFLGLRFLNTVTPKIENGCITLPLPGLFLGQAKDKRVMFIGIPEDEETRIKLCFHLISTAATGSSRDNEKIGDDSREVLVHFLLNPEELHLACGPTAVVLQSILDHAGVFSRRVHILNAHETMFERRGHMALEIRLNQKNAWQMADPHFGLLFQPGFSALCYAFTKWEWQKGYVDSLIPKQFFALDDLSTFNPDARLLSLEVRGAMITLANETIGLEPYAELKAHFEEKGLASFQMDFPTFFTAASYPNTVHKPIVSASAAVREDVA